MTLKNWIVLLIVALCLYGAVVLIAPKLSGMSSKTKANTETIETDPKDTGDSAFLQKSAPPKSTRHFVRQPLGENPHFLTDSFLTASLGALKTHGADLSKPMPSIHRVRCESEIAVDAIEEWGKSQGFEVAVPETVHLHGGIPNYMVDLIKNEVPDLSSIQSQGKNVAKATSEIEGVTYTTWLGAIVK